MTRSSTSVFLFVATILIGCASAGPPLPPAPEPRPAVDEDGLLGVPTQQSTGVEPAAVVREPDLAPRDRWGSPFAVSSVGQVARLQEREVVIIGADPTIEAGLEAQRGSRRAERPERRDTPAPADDSDRQRVDSDAMAVRIHRVGPGETLLGIARRYDVSPEEIRELNGIQGARVQSGELLVIPGPSN